MSHDLLTCFLLVVNTCTVRFQLTNEICDCFSWACLVIVSQGRLPLYLIDFIGSVAVLTNFSVNPVRVTSSVLSPELSVNTASFAKSAAMLGNSEDHTALSRALSQLAEVEEKIDQLHQEQAYADFYVFSELLGDYVRLITAVKVRRTYISVPLWIGRNWSMLIIMVMYFTEHGWLMGNKCISQFDGNALNPSLIINIYYI